MLNKLKTLWHTLIFILFYEPDELDETGDYYNDLHNLSEFDHHD
jgi:hypothetical protein